MQINDAAQTRLLRVAPADIQWHPGLPIFASEPFLRAVGDTYGWLGGFDDAGQLQVVLPYTIVRKPGFRFVRFRVETVHLGAPLSTDEERGFLNGAVEYFKGRGMDMIVPPTTNTIFRTVPDGAIAAPYGSFVVDLTPPQETLWSRVHSKHRNVIRNAEKKGVEVRSGLEYLPAAYALVGETLRRSKMSWMSEQALDQYVRSLEGRVEVLVALHEGVVQACAITPFSEYGAYYVYGGTCAAPVTGAANLLQWEAMRRFKELGVRRYDFVGARIGPDAGSKQAGLTMFKQRFGGELVQGYMWKYSFAALKFGVYSLAMRVLRGGDIIDQERRKHHPGKPPIVANSTATEPMTLPAPASRPHVTVCICTYRRPELLQRLLKHIAVQQTGDLFDLSVAVVDNDAAESGRSVVEAFRSANPWRITYAVEPVQNIAMARNRVVAQATGDYVAFIDDDEFPKDDWLRLLFEELRRTGVDGVLGPVVPHFDEAPPDWLVAGRFYERETHPTGTVLSWTSTRTGNALLDAGLLRGDETPFSPALGHGGEDRDFFKRQIAEGKRFTWCNEAIAYEVVPPHRWSRSFMLRRALHRGQGYRTNPSYSRLTVPTSIVAIAVYAVALPFCALRGQHFFMKYLIRLTDHVGKCLAFLGFTAIKEKYVTE